MPRSVAAHVAGAEAKVSKHGKVEGIRQQAQPSRLANKNLYSVDSALSAARHATLPAVPLSRPSLPAAHASSLSLSMTVNGRQAARAASGYGKDSTERRRE